MEISDVPLSDPPYPIPLSDPPLSDPGHDESAQGHAILWSLIASAQRHEIDVQLYLRSVLAHLPGLPPDELQNYLPDVWKRDLMAEQRGALNAHHVALAHVRFASPSA
jgi:hypothetical protein